MRGHAVDPGGAVGAPGAEPFSQPGVGGVDAVAEHVEVLAEHVDGRDLDGGHERDPVLARAAACAALTPATVSWSVSASSRTPAAAAAATTAAGSSAPSEHVEWDCRSKRGASSSIGARMMSHIGAARAARTRPPR